MPLALQGQTAMLAGCDISLNQPVPKHYRCTCSGAVNNNNNIKNSSLFIQMSVRLDVTQCKHFWEDIEVFSTLEISQ